MCRLRATAAAVAVVLALAGAGCGSDGDDGTDAAAQSERTGDPKQQVKDDYDQFIGNIYEGRWKQACAGYSDPYRAKYLKQAKLAKSCAEALTLEYAGIGTQPRPWISKVELKGSDRAIGVTKTSATSQGIPIKFVQVDGVWKLDGPATKIPQQ